MKIVGLTGGIGSGKTTVSRFFSEIGIPVYIADAEAKRLTNTSKVIRRKLIALLGEDAYVDKKINRSYVANKIFNDIKLLQAVNAVIHPKVAQHFKRWIKKQNGPYCIKEAAILFENGGYKNCDYVILVIAPRGLRIKRVIARDHTTKAQVESRMSNQWEDEKKRVLANFIIENTDLSSTKDQVEKIHAKIMARL